MRTRRLKDERIDSFKPTGIIRNQSNRLPGHEKRMREHIERVEREKHERQ